MAMLRTVMKAGNVVANRQATPVLGRLAPLDLLAVGFFLANYCDGP